MQIGSHVMTAVAHDTPGTSCISSVFHFKTLKWTTRLNKGCAPAQWSESCRVDKKSLDQNQTRRPNMARRPPCRRSSGWTSFVKISTRIGQITRDYIVIVIMDRISRPEEDSRESLARCIIRLIAFEMRLAISIKLSNWLMDSTESSGACDGCDRWEKHEFFLRTDHLCYAGGTDGLSLWGTSMCDVQLTLFVMFNPLLQEVINCKFPTKLCQSSPLNHIQSKSK